MSAEEVKRPQGSGVETETVAKPESSPVEDGPAPTGIEKGGDVEGQDEEGSRDRDAEEGYEGDPAGDPEGERSDGEYVGGRKSSVVETENAVVQVVEAGGSGEASSGGAGKGAGAESGSGDPESGGVGDRAEDEATSGAGAGSAGAEADEGAENGSDERKSAAFGDGPTEGSAAVGNERLAVAISVVDGKLGELFDASMAHSALLEEIAKGREPEQPGKDDVGEVLKGKLDGLDKQIGVVTSLVSKVSEGLEKTGEQEDEERTVKELKSWITDTLKEALNRLEEQISGLMDSGEQQVKAFEGVNLNVDVVKKVGESVGTLDEKLQGYKKDLSRERELGGGLRRWVLWSAIALAGPAMLLAGAVAGQRWEVLPLEDATGGWRDHVWESYGGDVVGCVRRSLRDPSSFECVLDVRGSVDEVRARASGR